MDIYYEKMDIYTDFDHYGHNNAQSITSIGRFESLHYGHVELIKLVCKKAKEKNQLSSLISIQKADAAHKKTIYTYSEKLQLWEKLNLDNLFLIHITEDISSISAKSFLLKILLKKINSSELVIGYDHQFGRNRRGTFKYLSRAAQKYNFIANRIEAVKVNEKIVSTTLVKEHLLKGEMKEVNSLLYFGYFMEGIVIHGEKKGRKIGFPTANIELSPYKLYPPEGVYAALVKFENKTFHALLNIGYRPTVKGNSLSVETHLIDFSADLYGKKIQIYPLQKLRNEEKFSDLSELNMNIHLDLKASRSVFNNLHDFIKLENL